MKLPYAELAEDAEFLKLKDWWLLAKGATMLTFR